MFEDAIALERARDQLRRSRAAIDGAQVLIPGLLSVMSDLEAVENALIRDAVRSGRVRVGCLTAQETIDYDAAWMDANRIPNTYILPGRYAAHAALHLAEHVSDLVTQVVTSSGRHIGNAWRCRQCGGAGSGGLWCYNCGCSADKGWPRAEE